ncbi:MAG: N-acetyltransferase [Opitutales bacterium TMED158]|nr:MAG: N-acetyltransferase [Opitutales bacterium TMED158]
MSEAFVHESSYVDDGVSIGPGTKVWRFCHLMTGSTIGENCSVGQNVSIGPRANVGNGVKIQNNVSIYEGVELEDDVFCGPSMVFTNVVNPRSHVSRRNEFKRTLVRRGATLGANCTIVCGSEIGEYAFVAAGAVVTKDVPSFGLVAGVPARRIGWVGRYGVGLVETGEANIWECPDTKERYRLTEDNGMTAMED